MPVTAIIVLREVLEAGLIVGIVPAASKGIPHRTRWVGLGVAAGVFGAAVVAACANSISELAEGMGQEIFDAATPFAAGARFGPQATPGVSR